MRTVERNGFLCPVEIEYSSNTANVALVRTTPFRGQTPVGYPRSPGNGKAEGGSSKEKRRGARSCREGSQKRMKSSVVKDTPRAIFDSVGCVGLPRTKVNKNLYGNSYAVASASHNVSLWEIEEYAPWNQIHPIIVLENIVAHLARSVVSLEAVSLLSSNIRVFDRYQLKSRYHAGKSNSMSNSCQLDTYTQLSVSLSHILNVEPTLLIANRVSSNSGGGREALNPIDVRRRVRGAGDTLSGAMWGSIADTRPNQYGDKDWINAEGKLSVIDVQCSKFDAELAEPRRTAN
ncbi:hypothetical protein B0H13DRAFT_1875358 [Mycena leptocephala]|nr:hypothetical protein B0H13DRAFT_1875358 [Mycena leptocephala]